MRMSSVKKKQQQKTKTQHEQLQIDKDMIVFPLATTVQVWLRIEVDKINYIIIIPYNNKKISY